MRVAHRPVKLLWTSLTALSPWSQHLTMSTFCFAGKQIYRKKTSLLVPPSLCQDTQMETRPPAAVPGPKLCQLSAWPSSLAGRHWMWRQWMGWWEVWQTKVWPKINQGTTSRVQLAPVGIPSSPMYKKMPYPWTIHPVKVIEVPWKQLWWMSDKGDLDWISMPKSFAGAIKTKHKALENYF